jgi:outer membrane protein insertion porin family
VVTFQVFERPTIRYVKFIGNEDLSDDTLMKKSGLKVGDALDLYSVDEAVSKIEAYYRSVGYVSARVFVQEGNQPQHKGVVIVVHEGKTINVLQTNFVGNTIVNGSRLKTLIKTVPGTLMIFSGKLDEKSLSEDIDKLTAYYRGLGFFRARVGRELEYSSSGEWVTVTFVIDEGPRYTIRNVSFVGNKIIGNEDLAKDLELKPGETYMQDKMDKDLNRIRRQYGAQGYVFSEIQAEPRFGLEPGVLDLVYSVKEGNQYRVGNVYVKIEGDYPHTRRTVALNRLSIRPGDIIDIREIQASERRLRASQLFQDSPQMGISPRIVVLPPDGLEMDGKRR